MRYKCADLDNVQIQLCEPPAARRRRSAPFSMRTARASTTWASSVADRDRGAEARALGLSVTARGKRADGSGFAYFDTRAGSSGKCHPGYRSRKGGRAAAGAGERLPQPAGPDRLTRQGPESALSLTGIKT